MAYIIDDLYNFYMHLDTQRKEKRKELVHLLIEQYVKFWRLGDESQRQKDLLKGLSDEEIIENKIKKRINEYITGKHNSKLDDNFYGDNFRRLKKTYQKYVNTERLYYLNPFYTKKINYSKQLTIEIVE